MQCKLVNLQTTCANQSHQLIDNTGQKGTTHSFPLLKMKHNFLRNSFFPSLRLCLIGKGIPQYSQSWQHISRKNSSKSYTPSCK